MSVKKIKCKRCITVKKLERMVENTTQVRREMAWKGFSGVGWVDQQAAVLMGELEQARAEPCECVYCEQSRLVIRV